MTDHQEIHEKHSELFHYTDKKGIVGILTSQSLWATHFRFLNDSTEIQLMRAVLSDRFFPTVREVLVKQYGQVDIKRRKEMEKAGGAIGIHLNFAANLSNNVGPPHRPKRSKK